MHALLVVDVQPAYSNWCNTVVKDVVKRINNTRKPTVIMWVGDGITADAQEDVTAYLQAHGARPGKLEACRFVEKNYGFFRSWMDRGVPHDTIVKVGREMYANNAYSSDEVDMAAIGVDKNDLPGSDIILPSFDTHLLHHFDAFDTCGGGADECLAEVELYLQMKNKAYNRLDHIIY